MGKIKRLITIIEGTFKAYLITLIMLLIYSAILEYTSMPESTIPICVFVISMISVFMASSLMVIKMKENGLKNGGLIGLVYIALLYILSSMTSVGFGLNRYAIAIMFFTIFTGMVGGIIGVNIAK